MEREINYQLDINDEFVYNQEVVFWGHGCHAEKFFIKSSPC